MTWTLQHEKLDDFEPFIQELYELAFASERRAKTIVFPSERAYVISCHRDWVQAQERIANEVISLYDRKRQLADELKETRKTHGNRKGDYLEFEKIITVIENRVQVLRRLVDAIAQRFFENKMWMAKRFLLNSKLQKPDIEAIKGNLESANYANGKNPCDFWLIADLTSYIGVGDLILRQYLGQGKFKWTIVELKVGNTNKELYELTEGDKPENEERIARLDTNSIKQLERMKRQQFRTREIRNFINQGRGTDIRTGMELRLDPREVSQVRYDKELIDIIRGAKESQVALGVLDGCLSIYASTLNDFDTFHFLYHVVYKGRDCAFDNDVESRKKDELSAMQKMLHHPYVKDIILHNLKACYHTSFFSLPIEDVLNDLLFGRMRVVLYLDIQKFCDLCIANGFKVESLTRKETIFFEGRGENIPLIDNRGIKLTTPNGVSFVLGRGSVSKVYYDLARPLSLIMNLERQYSAATKMDE